MTGKEAEQLEDLDIKSKISGHYYKNMRYFQDGMTRANVCIKDSLPEEFDAEIVNDIWFLAGAASERVNDAIKSKRLILGWMASTMY